MRQLFRDYASKKPASQPVTIDRLTSFDSKVSALELETAMREGKQKANRAKITLVGPGRAGKTCLARSFLNMKFEDTASTQGIEDMGLRSIVHYAESREGQWGEYGEFERMYEGFLAHHIHDQRITPKPSREESKDYSDFAPYYDGSTINPLNNEDMTLPRYEKSSQHQDVESSIVDIPINEDYVERTMGMMQSSGMSLVVSIHDFGGQRVFDVIHSLFLGPHGVYVIVFNMEWMLSDYKSKCIEYLKSWINALIVHSSTLDDEHRLKCATIAIVGTHKDKVTDLNAHQTISNELEEIFGKSLAWRSVLENDAESLCFFPIDCTLGQGDTTLVNLMKAIETDILQSDYVNVERPLAYFKVLDEMNEAKKGTSYLSLVEVIAMANKYGIHSQHLKVEMLRFFRDLGLIMWHEEPSLRDIIVLDPIKFFVAPATNIVCQHVIDEQGTVHFNEVLKKAKKTHRLDFDAMLNEGMVTSNLLKFVLDEHIKSDNRAVTSRENAEARYAAVKYLMLKYNLIVPIFAAEEEKVSSMMKYLVPSLLPTGTVADCSQSYPNTIYFSCTTDDMNSLFYSVSLLRTLGFLPPGLFQRFTARMLTEIDATKGGGFRFVNRDKLFLFIGTHKFAITAVNDLGCIRIEWDGGSVNGPLRLLVEIILEIKRESFKELKITTAVPYPSTGKDLKGLLTLDALKHQRNNFVIEGSIFDINRDMITYRVYMDEDVAASAFDVFISYRWEPVYQKTVARNLFNKLSGTPVPDDHNRPLHVYLDQRSNNLGESIVKNIYTALSSAKVFMPLVTESVLQVMVRTDHEKTVDFVLLEWILILALQSLRAVSILPVFVPTLADPEAPLHELDIRKLKEGLPEVTPSETLSLAKRLLAERCKDVKPSMSSLESWSLKVVVLRILDSLGVQWSDKNCIGHCRQRILSIIGNREP